MSIDEQLRTLPESKADPNTLPSAAESLQEKLDLLPASGVSLSELVEQFSKKAEN